MGRKEAYEWSGRCCTNLMDGLGGAPEGCDGKFSRSMLGRSMRVVQEIGCGGLGRGSDGRKTVCMVQEVEHVCFGRGSRRTWKECLGGSERFWKLRGGTGRSGWGSGAASGRTGGKWHAMFWLQQHSLAWGMAEMWR